MSFTFHHCFSCCFLFDSFFFCFPLTSYFILASFIFFCVPPCSTATPLQVMERGTAEVLKECLQRNAAVSPWIQAFRWKCRASCTDKAGYNLKADSSIARDRGTQWAALHTDCEVHCTSSCFHWQRTCLAKLPNGDWRNREQVQYFIGPSAEALTDHSSISRMLETGLNHANVQLEAQLVA